MNLVVEIEYFDIMVGTNSEEFDTVTLTVTKERNHYNKKVLNRF